MKEKWFGFFQKTFIHNHFLFNFYQGRQTPFDLIFLSFILGELNTETTAEHWNLELDCIVGCNIQVYMKVRQFG